MATGPEIKAAREAKGLSQDAVARAVGISQPALKKIEDGGVQRSRFMPDIEQFLGLPGSTQASGFRPPPQIIGARDMKVFAAAEGGSGELVVGTDPIDIVARPWFVEHVSEAYAVLVTGESMVPVYRPGHLAIVNPKLPAMKNEDHIFVAGEDHGEFRATIKHLIGWNTKEWTVEQFNPFGSAPFALPKATWPKALRVVGSYRR